MAKEHDSDDSSFEEESDDESYEFDTDQEQDFGGGWDDDEDVDISHLMGKMSANLLNDLGMDDEADKLKETVKDTDWVQPSSAGLGNSEKIMEKGQITNVIGGRLINEGSTYKTEIKHLVDAKRLSRSDTGTLEDRRIAPSTGHDLNGNRTGRSEASPRLSRAITYAGEPLQKEDPKLPMVSPPYGPDGRSPVSPSSVRPNQGYPKGYTQYYAQPNYAPRRSGPNMVSTPHPNQVPHQYMGQPHQSFNTGTSFPVQVPMQVPMRIPVPNSMPVQMQGPIVMRPTYGDPSQFSQASNRSSCVGSGGRVSFGTVSYVNPEDYDDDEEDDLEGEIGDNFYEWFNEDPENYKFHGIVSPDIYEILGMMDEAKKVRQEYCIPKGANRQTSSRRVQFVAK